MVAAGMVAGCCNGCWAIVTVGMVAAGMVAGPSDESAGPGMVTAGTASEPGIVTAVTVVVAGMVAGTVASGMLTDSWTESVFSV